MAEWPVVPRSTYEAVCTERDRLVLREQALIAQVARTAKDWGNRLTRAEKRLHARLSESHKAIASAVATAEAERHQRLAADHECQRLRDLLASRPAAEASVPEFQQLPPAVASALAQVSAGLPGDVQRQMRAKAAAMLVQGETEATVAAAILQGETVEL